MAYVYLPNGTMFNETLVQKGYAQVYTVLPNVIYQERFLAAQQEAKAAGRGLWGLSASELCHLTDRGNGIGEGSGIGEDRRVAQLPLPPATALWRCLRHS